MEGPIDTLPWKNTEIDPGFSPWPLYVVYEILGTGVLVMAKATAVVPGIYRMVFGPASYAACAAYVWRHSKEPEPFHIISPTPAPKPSGTSM